MKDTKHWGKETKQENQTNAGLVLGILGIMLGIASIFDRWWLCIFGDALGIISMFFPKKLWGILALILNTIAWIVIAVIFFAKGAW